ncbi:MAG: hypothetical protein R3D68_20535 [Hyphomicrobiaceae bacterium]
MVLPMSDSTHLDKLLARATSNLSIQTSDASASLVRRRLESVAAELALEWIAGERRFESLSQQTEHWLARLYEELYRDEQPEATRIYARFGLPLPRAAYLTRLLLARNTGQWRDAAHREVLNSLNNVETKAQDAANAKAAKTQRFDLSLSRGGYEQLVVLYDFVARTTPSQDRPAPPRRNPSSGSLIWFSITAETALALLVILRKE